MWRLKDRVAAVLADPAVDSVVLTHGTDTLEETAFLLDLTLDATKPVVMCGAMRTVSEPGWDGPANLLAAVRFSSPNCIRTCDSSQPSLRNPRFPPTYRTRIDPDRARRISCSLGITRVYCLVAVGDWANEPQGASHGFFPIQPWASAQRLIHRIMKP
jgi:hypothetical protein